MSSSRSIPTIIGTRLRTRREQLGWSLERVGVAIGLDESSARARISRYELGVHEPPEPTAEQLAKVLEVPLPYLHCADDRLAQAILAMSKLPVADQEHLIASVHARLEELNSKSSRKG